MRGQVSVEFLLIIGMLSVAILPILFAMNFAAQDSPDRLSISKATFSAARIASSAQAVGNLGPGSKIRAQVEMPHVRSISVNNNEVALDVQTTYGNVIILQQTDFQMHGRGLESISAPGSYIIDIYSDTQGIVNLELVK
ncbi:hypothetical protein COU37_02465 [Candidatus Micrarchaeota archaeon CG10_big_fil_rev_8_21_14_0_10_45_29]|nr:MAG: hypothetical protein COU37_02465 [Candidatus Micrarchaeota archaeon CG10_big_fil_rev_8_21_14_0_10_45_29]